MGVPWLILPTFDEAENIEAIVRAADAVLAQAAAGGHRILVVDDDSPDGTGQIADRLAAELDSVEVLHPTERQGLGPAYLRASPMRLPPARATSWRCCVHLHDMAGPVGQSMREAREIRGAEPLSLGPVQDLDAVELGGQPVGDLAGTVG